MYTLILVFVSGKMFTCSAHWFHPMFSVYFKRIKWLKMFWKHSGCRRFFTQSWAGLGRISFTALIDFLVFQIGNAWRECVFLSSIRLWLRPLASVDVTSPICPIYPQRRQTIPSSPRDVVRDGGGQSTNTVKEPFTQLFQSAAKWKHILLPLIKRATTNEKQLWKPTSRPSTWIIPL